MNAVPVILQSEAAECGLACLAMVASAHGLRSDLPALRQRFEVSGRGMTLGTLVRAADALRLMPRALRAELDELPQLQLPCVLHWDLNHFVVLVALRDGVATVHDPARGRCRLRLDEVSRHFTGVALELQPAADFERADWRRPVTLRGLLGPVPGLRRALGQLLLLALALEVFVLAAPLFLQWVVDDVLASGDRGWLLTLAAGFAGLVVVQAAIAAARAWAVRWLSASLGLQWQLRVFTHLLRLPAAWFEKRQTGDVWSRFEAVHEIQRSLTTSFVEALLDGLLVVAMLALMLAYSPQLAAIVLVAVALYAALRALFYRPLRLATESLLVRQARQGSHFLETLRGVQAIKLFNAHGDRGSRFASRVVETTDAEVAVRRLEDGFVVLQRLLFGLERVAVVAAGAWLVLDQRLSVGMLFAFLAYKDLFSQRVGALIDKAVELQMLRLQGERLADIVHAEAEPDGPEQPAVPQGGALELRDLHFRYADGEPEVLRGVSLVVAEGESLAIVGPSGCGKTTLLKLMLGLLTPSSGELLVGGVPLSRLGLRAWRDRVGVVMQDEPLFSGTVAENIAFFDPAPDVEWVLECAQLAGVHDEIAALPMGYDTLIGDMGSSLSGGQKQRVLLARALYKRPQLLFLDEATSALDVERERLVNQAVRQLPLTRIIVAHRPETIASASRVVALADGRVAQDLRTVPPAVPSAVVPTA